MRDLYPDIEPYDSGTLRVDDRHTLYYEQCGNPKGKPVVLLHGGPGAGCSPKMRRFHDPEKYRIVLFDQRGSGRSTPHADLVGNTTWDLVADIEKLRDALRIDRWQVFGGSWGSTLALAYAQSHPQRVTELVLRGIFMLRRWELEWFYQEGASRLFPDAWQHFIAAIPPVERHDLISAFHRRLTSDDEATRLSAARAWSVWEGATSFLHVDPDFVSGHEDARFALAFARIENHYFVNGGFFDVEDQLLRDAHRIADIPGVIVHGRYDVVCPLQNAWELHKAWPKSMLTISPASGHSAFEAENVDALVRVRRYRRDLLQRRSDADTMSLRWIDAMALSQIAIWCIAVAQWLFRIPWIDFPLIYGAVAVWVFVVGYLSLSQVAVAAAPPHDEAPAATTPASAADDARFPAVEARLSQLMSQEQLFREPALTIGQLAKRSGYPEYLVSAVINRRFEGNFWDYINRQRIEAARACLADAGDTRTILDIAYACGFTSKSTFNAAFKRQLDVTPSAYRQGRTRTGPA